MKSSELAALAGVTVRALRHYHQLGVLPEPERGYNGYRSYDARDLIRLLRIKRLAAIGIPLDAMGELLDDDGVHRGGAGPAALLDELEEGIDAELARLQQQKRLISGLRTAQALDLPPELALIVDSFAASAPPSVRRMDREQAVLLAHLAGEEGLDGLTQVYKKMSSPDLAEQVLQFYAGFAALTPETPAEDLERLVAGFMETVAGPVKAALAGSETPLFADESAVAAVFDEYRHSALNSAQQLALARITARLESAG
ncbi:MerR family transcriptional regulator [Arthrobacter citreus]|jgi:DNA-binding transcriptional MerR regulator|uniref:MerR family transcriptional regulator n=1 Tax=Arthrobacter citreus TaxID=1670 RepID=A0ABZ2ZUB0_9MICC